MRRIACVCLAAVMAALSWPAYGASLACSSRDDVLAQLLTKFKEVPTNDGVANNGGLLEVLRTADGATWTIIVTMPNGVSCLVAAGEDWRDYKDVQFPIPGRPM